MRGERVYGPGDIIASLYEVKEVFAGGMGEVYLAFHRERKTHYALKTIQEKYFRSKTDFMAFKREVEVWIMLHKHSNIVQAITAREFEGRLYLALEYIEPDAEGRNTLAHFLTGTPIDPKQSLIWGLQFCDGMIYATGKGLKCHRDIKPGNIMVTRDGVVKITDFGLAKTIQSSDRGHSPVSQMGYLPMGSYEITVAGGTTRGTPAYMAPETFLDYKNADEVSDVYSFGVVMFQMASGGDRPFTPGVNSFEAYRYVHTTQPVPRVPSPLFPLIDKCLAKSRTERSRSFSELRMALESTYRDVVGGSPPPPLEVTVSEEDRRYFAQALYELQHYENALAECDRALQSGARDHEAWNLRGQICHALERRKEAREAFDRALEIQPDYYASWNNKGMLLQESGRADEALACFRRVISLRPDYREAWNNMGVCLQSQGRVDEAIAHYGRAVALDRRYRDAWVNMGDCLIRRRQYPDAVECYEMAEVVDPHEPYILENLERLYRMLNLPEKAQMVRKKRQGEE